MKSEINGTQSQKERTKSQPKCNQTNQMKTNLVWSPQIALQIALQMPQKIEFKVRSSQP